MFTMVRFSLNDKTCCLHVMWEKIRSNLGKKCLHHQKYPLPYTYDEACLLWITIDKLGCGIRLLFHVRAYFAFLFRCIFSCRTLHDCAVSLL